MTSALTAFHHVYVDNKQDKTVFLFHGTGGSERDLLFLDESLHQQYNLVGLRGNVDESGLRRFFRRSETGVFDQESIREESARVYEFMTAWQQQHRLAIANTVCLGYSNGANIILATLLRYPESFRTAVLLHPMVPFIVPAGTVDLSQHRIFVSNGIYDQLVSSEQRKAVQSLLESQHSNPTIHDFPNGHEISDADLNDVVKFLEIPG